MQRERGEYHVSRDKVRGYRLLPLPISCRISAVAARTMRAIRMTVIHMAISFLPQGNAFVVFPALRVYLGLRRRP